MAVKIKLKRIGKIRVPQYRIVVADARTSRSGRAIEEIGIYHPKEDPSVIRVDSDRVQHWLSAGAQPTEPVVAILKVTGDWQRFKGLPGAEGTLKVAEPKTDKTQIFEAAAKEALGEKDRIDEVKARAAKKAAEAREVPAEEAPQPAAPAEEPAAEAPAAEAPAAEAPAAEAPAAESPAPEGESGTAEAAPEPESGSGS